MKQKEKDNVNITISDKSQKIIDIIKECDFFSDDISVARFAVAYAISKSLFNPESIEKFNLDGMRINKWSQGTVDKDGFFGDVISVLYPNIEFPYIVIKNLIEIGLYDIEKNFLKKGKFRISDLI